LKTTIEAIPIGNGTDKSLSQITGKRKTPSPWKSVVTFVDHSIIDGHGKAIGFGFYGEGGCIFIWTRGDLKDKYDVWELLVDGEVYAFSTAKAGRVKEYIANAVTVNNVAQETLPSGRY
jgi:hypothetical protein